MPRLLLIILILLFSSCRKIDQPSVYRYEVLSEAKSLGVQYQDEFEHIISEAYVESGWQYSWVQVGPRYLSIRAKNNTMLDCKITVRIWCDDKIVAQATRIGPLNVAYISGVF